jgi:O-antigen/teichoic acid export membrane protein
LDAGGQQAEEAAQRAGIRAFANTAFRAGAEILGKLATLALYAGLARAAGVEGLGTFVLAASFAELGLIVVDLGLDQYMTREVARDRGRRSLFPNVIALKLALLAPVVLAMAAITVALDYSGETRAAVFLLTAGFFGDSLIRTEFALFMAHEHGRPVATVVLVQRIATAAVGLTLLAAGLGVVAVAATYAVCAAGGFLLGAVLLTRSIGFPRWTIRPSSWRDIAVKSLPFAIQVIFMVMLFRLDAVILAQLSTDRAVGDYGAAYRMFEATLFIPYAIASSFAAMYSYLTPTSSPTIGFVFGRSIKFAVACLLPIGIIFGVFAGDLLTTIFGDEFAEATGALELLAGGVPLIGIVVLCSTFIVSRGPSRALVVLTGSITALNIALNFALIPDLDQDGAATAMLVSEGLFAIGGLIIADRQLGGFGWLNALLGPVIAAAVMFGVAVAAPGPAVVAAALAMIVYAVVFLGFERTFSPDDFRFVRGLMSGAARSKGPGALTLEERE